MSCVSRVDSLSAIITNYSQICESLIKIEGKSSSDVKSKASGHRRIVRGPRVHNCNRGTPVCSVIFENLNTFPSKDKLRYGCAFDQAQNTLNTLKGLRTDEKYSELFARVQIIADTMEVVLQPRRRVGRQAQMSILPNNYGEQCTNAFLDHVNNELERRFPGDQWQMMLGQYLIPSKFDQVVYWVVDELSIVFWADLPDLVT